MKKLHIACGTNYMKGWINTDISPNVKIDKYLNASKIFPFNSGEINYIYSEHFIEHLTLIEGKKCFKECKRILSPNGTIRLSTPDLNVMLNRYINKELLKLGTWNPKTLCDQINEGMRLWGHKYVYDFEKLSLILKECGFKKIIRCEYKKSKISELNNLETRVHRGELILEVS
jgi:predicted SAM-dependent methyltransferase